MKTPEEYDRELWKYYPLCLVIVIVVAVIIQYIVNQKNPQVNKERYENTEKDFSGYSSNIINN